MKLTLVRGLPGSGKTTMANSLMTGPFDTHLEADMYFMRDGTYQFDATKLSNAHQWCLQQTEFWLTRYIRNDARRAIVSNTFTTVRELRPYFDLAQKLKIVPTVILCQNQFQNVHGVPEETMSKMQARFQYDLSDLWKNFSVDNSAE